MSLKFLNNKTWHTATIANQARVFEAEQAEEFRKKKELERQKILESERAYDQGRQLMRTHGHNDTDLLKGKGGALSFMYEPPPGLISETDNHSGNTEKKSSKDIPTLQASKGAPVKEAGGRNIEEGESDSGALNPAAIKPFGLEIRNVRCVKCKQWGHQMGDAVCPMKAVSVETEEFRQLLEDPLMVFDRSRGAAVTERLVLRQTLDGIHGGHSADAESQQILLSDDDEKVEMPPSKDERKAMKKRMKELRKKLKVEKQKHKKKKKKSKKKGDSSSSSSSSSNSGSNTPNLSERHPKGAIPSQSGQGRQHDPERNAGSKESARLSRSPVRAQGSERGARRAEEDYGGRSGDADRDYGSGGHPRREAAESRYQSGREAVRERSRDAERHRGGDRDREWERGSDRGWASDRHGERENDRNRAQGRGREQVRGRARDGSSDRGRSSSGR